MINRFFRWARAHRLAVTLFLIILLAVGFLGYRKFTLEQNKRAFTEARATIDTIYAGIVSRIGQPDNSRRTSECSRPSVEFGKGPLFCGVSTNFIYGVTDKSEADALKLRIQNVIGSHPGLLLQIAPPAPSVPINPAPGNNSDSQNNYYRTMRGMECTVKYTYDMPREIQLSLKDSSKKGLGVAMGCSSSARSEFYPIHQAE